VFIYVITNTYNSNCYVGKSCQPARRWSQHKVDARNPNKGLYNYPLYRALRKHGVEAFEFAVVEECESEAASYDAEARWIERLKPAYNQCAGGVGTTRPNAEVRARMSAAKAGKKQSPEAVAARAASNTGKKRSAEQRERIAAGQRGKKRSTPAWNKGLKTGKPAWNRATVDDAALVSMRVAGWKLKDIASAVGLSIPSVHKRLARLSAT
jgi:group I intron endonuclease